VAAKTLFSTLNRTKFKKKMKR